MFVKFHIMRSLTFDKPINYEVLEQKFRNKDKFMLAIDLLGKAHYIDAFEKSGKLYLRLETVAAYERYKHDVKVTFAEWFIKVLSFIIIIATLFLTADTERLHTIWQWLSSILHL